MKKIITLFLALQICFNTFAQQLINTPIEKKAPKEYEKLIHQLDVLKYINYQDTNINPTQFWDAIYNNHIIFNKWKDAVNNNNRLAAKALNSCETKLQKFQQVVNTNMTTIEFEEWEKHFTKILCGDKFKLPINFVVVDENIPNAWVYPNGDIYMTNSLIQKMTEDQLVGIAAHEIAHYIIKHSYLNEWASNKKELSNIIIAATFVAADAAVSTWAASEGVEIDWDGKEKEYDNIIGGFLHNAYLYQFKNSRKQELEADIVALRFLEYININPQEYINALKKLGTEYDNLYDEESDHPTTSYRIDFLTYLTNNYSAR